MCRSPHLMALVFAFALPLGACSFDFSRADRPCRTDSHCDSDAACDTLRGICAPARYFSAEATVQTYAGSGAAGSSDGPRATATLNGPSGLWWVATDASLIVADRSGHRLRRVTATISAIAGGDNGFADGALADARFTLPTAIVASVAGDRIFVADTGNHRLRLIEAGAVTTVAGEAGGFVNGTLAQARFQQPQGVAFFGRAGALVLADSANHRLRIIDPSKDSVSTLAGGAAAGFADGPAAEAQFNTPAGVAVDSEGRVFVADAGNNRIRVVESDGVVRTLAGGAEGGYADGPAAEARFLSPQGLAVSSTGVVFVADTLNARVRVIEGGQVSTLSGGAEDATVDGDARQARFERPVGIAIGENEKTIFVADQRANRIRRIALP